MRRANYAPAWQRLRTPRGATATAHLLAPPSRVVDIISPEADVAVRRPSRRAHVRGGASACRRCGQVKAALVRAGGEAGALVLDERLVARRHAEI